MQIKNDAQAAQALHNIADMLCAMFTKTDQHDHLLLVKHELELELAEIISLAALIAEDVNRPDIEDDRRKVMLRLAAHLLDPVKPIVASVTAQGGRA